MSRAPEQRAGVTNRDLSGKRALVTGSTSGIGRETALSLARLGADVIVHGRDTDAGAAVVEELRALGSDAQFVRADFADVDAVQQLADTVQTETDELDVLVNNAGGMFREGRLTDLGVEYTFHVNHLAPFLLTTELLDHVADGGRIVTTGSLAHRGIRLDLDEVTDVERHTGWRAYQRSKLANVQFALALARRLDAAGREVTSNTLHPGAIPGSGFSRFLPSPIPETMSLLDGLPLVTSVEDGAAGLVYLAAADEVEGVSGRYFSKRQPRKPSREARNRDAQRRLWERSAAFLDIEEPLAEPAAVQ